MEVYEINFHDKWGPVGIASFFTIEHPAAWIKKIKYTGVIFNFVAMEQVYQNLDAIVSVLVIPFSIHNTQEFFRKKNQKLIKTPRFWPKA